MPLTTASLTPVSVGPNGTGKIADLVAATTQAAQAGGDAFTVQGKEVLVVLNGSGAPITVTVASVADNFGSVLSSHDITQAISAGKICVIGPLERSKFADANGLAQVTYSGVTSLTIKLLAFPVTG